MIGQIIIFKNIVASSSQRFQQFPLYFSTYLHVILK
jgi:hypothetical protein